MSFVFYDVNNVIITNITIIISSNKYEFTKIQVPHVYYHFINVFTIYDFITYVMSFPYQQQYFLYVNFNASRTHKHKARRICIIDIST